MITTIAKRRIIVRSVYFGFALLIFISGMILLRSHQTSYQEVRLLYAEIQAKQQLATVIDNTLMQSFEERELLSRYFLSERATISFITEVEQLARQNQMALETTQLSVSPATESTPGTLTVGFSYEGTYGNVVTLTGLIETLPYHLNVSRITMKKFEQGKWKGEVVLTLTLQ